MIDLSNVTFNIPVRIDTQHRLENVNLVVDYLNHHFKTNIIVCEEDKEKKLENLSSKCTYHYIKSDNSHFHRTRILNLMAKMSQTSIIVNYDTDVLFKVSEYVNAANVIDTNYGDVCFPYNGRFYDVPRSFYASINETKSLDGINLSSCGLLTSSSVGGAIFWNKNKFMEIGMENENFKSWGFEDNERIARCRRLGLRIIRTPDILYHIEHSKSTNSGPHNHFYWENQRECAKVEAMTAEEIKQYIKTWSWVS